MTFRRFTHMRSEDMPSDAGKIRLLASTDDAVDMGGWREVLKHDKGCVDTSAARSLLINHDPNQLAGRISGIEVNGREMNSDADIDEDAEMASGVNVRKAVANGSLRGVSIGYTYDRADTQFDEESRTLTVNRWRLLEITLTAIPADAKAQVRSFPFSDQPTAPANPAAHKQEARVSDPNQPAPQAIPPAAPINQAANDERVRAAAIQESREIAELARDHKLDASKYIGQSKADASAAMLRDLAERNRSAPPEQVPLSINVDQADKARDAFLGALAHGAGFRDGSMADLQKGNPLVGRGIQHAVKRYARLMGIQTDDWSKNDVANFMFGRPGQMSESHGRAANVVSSQFPNFVFLNAITKIVAKGYEQGSAVARYKRIVDTQTVPDFKQFSIGALAGGNLTQTAENIAFPELTKAEGVYNSQASMWGATMSLSLQAVVNDDTAQFDRLLRMAGAIADKTIDQRVFQKLLMGTSAATGTSTWTSNTTSGASIVFTTADTLAAARANLGKPRAALMNKIGLDGNPLGTMPRFLIVGPTNETNARALFAPTGGQVSSPETSLEIIVSPWLEASALTGNSTTSYYMLADPMDVTGLILSKIMGYESIQVQPYDAGAVAAMNFKLWLPFEADLTYLTVGSTKTIAAAQQGTT